MGTLFVQTTGNAANSGSSDNNAQDLIGTSATFISGTTVQLDSGTVLTGVNTSGANQSAINIAGATNVNRTVFWITGVSGSGGATPQVTLDVAPTGMTTNAWRIGGRYIYPSAAIHDVVVNALRAGDTLQFNDTPAAKTTVPFIATGSSGDTTSGRINVIGKAGQSVTLATTGSSTSVGFNNANWYLGNLTITNTSNNIIVNIGASGCIVEGCTINGTGVNAAQNGIAVTATGYQFIKNNIGPVGGIGINPQSSANSGLIFGNYIHGAAIDGITMGSTNPSHTIVRNIITGNGGRGVYASGTTAAQAHALILIENTIYGNTLAGFEAANINTVAALFGNIISNSSSSGLVTWPSGASQSIHEYNVYYSSSTGANTNWTAGVTEATSDPLFTAVGSGNYAIGSSGSAAGSGYPGIIPGALSTGFADIGAVQRQVTGSSGGSVIGS